MVKMTTIIFLISVFMSVTGIALAEEITCPSVTKINENWMMLESVSKLHKNLYQISENFSSFDDDKHRAWSITTFVFAPTMSQALLRGRQLAKNDLSLKQPYALKLDKIFLCIYRSSTFAVAALSLKDDQEKDYKLTQLKLPS